LEEISIFADQIESEWPMIISRTPPVSFRLPRID
jgi:hypothetical protein